MSPIRATGSGARSDVRPLREARREGGRHRVLAAAFAQPVHRGEGRGPRGPPGRAPRHRRPVGLRKDDVPQRGRRPHPHRRREPHARRARDQEPRARPRDGVPAARTSSLAHGPWQCHFRRRGAGNDEQERGGGAGEAADRARRPQGFRGRVPPRALGRHAAARQPSARASHRPRDAAAGRAVRGARCADARDDAARAPQDLVADPQDGALHHARHQRGDLPRGPRHRVHAPPGTGEERRRHQALAPARSPREARPAVPDLRGRDLGVDPGGARRPGGAPHRGCAGGMSIQSWEPAAPTTTLDRPPAQERRSVVKPSPFKQYEPVVIGTLSVVLALAAWQLVANARIYSILFVPGPWDVAQAFVKLFQTGDIWLDIGTSGAEIGIGYGMAVVAGLALGLLMGWYTRFQYALDPFVNFFYSTPRIVLIPLFILWFGIEMQPKIAVIFLGALFPIIINTMAGVRNQEAALLRVARSFGAPDALIFRRVVLPGSVPSILTGFRLGVGHALTGVVVGELIAAKHGVGQLIATAGQTFQTPKLLAGVILIAGTGMLLTTMIQRVENRFQSWRPQIR